MSQDSSIIGSICSCCGLFLFSALEPWCNTKRYGCGNYSCSGPRGCCHSCFEQGFNEDSWDKEDAQRRAAEGGEANGNVKDKNNKRVSGEQPAPVVQMSAAPVAEGSEDAGMAVHNEDAAGTTK